MEEGIFGHLPRHSEAQPLPHRATKILEKSKDCQTSPAESKEDIQANKQYGDSKQCHAKMAERHGRGWFFQISKQIYLYLHNYITI